VCFGVHTGLQNTSISDGWNVPLVAPDTFAHRVAVLDEHRDASADRTLVARRTPFDVVGPDRLSAELLPRPQ
jgi:hypothetical protein